MGGSVSLDADRLRELLTGLFARHGCAPSEAAAVARHLVDADLSGHPSHGSGLTPIYIANLGSGAVQPNRTLASVPQSTGMLLFDGGCGFGQSLGLQLVEQVLVHTSGSGVGIFGLRQVHHLGRIGDYGERFAAAGYASVMFVNTVSRPIVAPFGGVEARMGTNPVCITIPRRAAPPVVLDFATSAIAIGKCRVALEKGEPIIPGVALDASGEPTTDPQALYTEPQGALRAMGGYKGSGLNLVCELFSACIGGLTMPDARPASGGAINNLVGMCFRAGVLSGAFERVETAIAHYLSTRSDRVDGPVMLPGDPERRARTLALRGGVPLAAKTWAAIAELARAAELSGAMIAAVPLADPEGG